MSGGFDGEPTRALVLERIRADSRFVLATHEHPDGDALGSLVGMQELLLALGKDSAMFIAPEDLPIPNEYRSFQLQGAIQAPPADISERTVVFLDCGNIDRNSARVLRDGAHLLNIDHHHDNTRFGTIAQHAHVHPGMAQIGAGPDIGHGHESHTRVLQLSCHRVADHLTDRLVDAPHASVAHPIRLLHPKTSAGGHPA